MKWLPQKKVWPLKKADNKPAADAVRPPGDEVNENFRRPLRLGLMILIFGFCGILLWAGLAPLGQGAVAPGVVEVSGYRKVVQYLERGTVEAINVDNGDVVQAGDVLIRINPVRARSQRNNVSSQYIIARSREDRLVAEATGTDTIAFDEDLKARFHDDPRYQRAIKIQKQLFDSRQEAREGELAILRENKQGAQQRLKSLKSVLSSRRQQISRIHQQLDGVRSLAEQGYLPRNKMLELERQAAALQAQLYSDTVAVGKTENQIKELELKILQYKHEFRKKVQSKLGEVQAQTSSLSAQLEALDYAVKQTSIRASVDGVIQNLSIHTIGATVTPGTTLMEIVPEETNYVIRAQLPVSNIDRVQNGLPVEITFPTLNSAWVPSVHGKVDTVSASRLVDERSGRPYYSVQVSISDKGLQELSRDSVQLQPGMSATVTIQLGTRSVLSYFFKPLFVRLNVALSE